MPGGSKDSLTLSLKRYSACPALNAYEARESGNSLPRDRAQLHPGRELLLLLLFPPRARARSFSPSRGALAHLCPANPPPRESGGRSSPRAMEMRRRRRIFCHNFHCAPRRPVDSLRAPNIKFKASLDFTGSRKKTEAGESRY